MKSLISFFRPIFNAIVAFSKKHPKWAAVIVVASFVFTMIDEHQKEQEAAPEPSQITETVQSATEAEKDNSAVPEAIEVAEEVETPAPTVLVDLPQLFALNIDQLRNELADDATIAEQKEFEATFPDDADGTSTFLLDGNFLTAYFNKANRGVTKYSISTSQNTFSMQEKSDLIAQSGLRENSDEYTVKAVPFLQDESVFTALTVQTTQQANAEKEVANVAVIAEIQPMLDELREVGLIMKIQPQSGELHVSPWAWAALPIDQKEALAAAIDQYFRALPNSQIGLWGIVNGLTGERIAKLNMWGGLKVVE